VSGPRAPIRGEPVGNLIAQARMESAGLATTPFARRPYDDVAARLD
jgi:hypothetical protein